MNQATPVAANSQQPDQVIAPVTERESVSGQELCLGDKHRSPAKLFCGDDVFAMVYLTDHHTRRRTTESEERARRLVACWNVCVGMSTEDVEAWAAENKRKRDALAADEALLESQG